MKKFLFFIPFFLFPLGLLANGVETSPRYLVHLLDYIAQDYGGAVSQGKVTSQSEYKEQLEFSETAIEISQKIPQTTLPEMRNQLENLHGLIVAKTGADSVARLAQEIKDKVIKVTGLEISPAQWPSLNRGREAFNKNCASCHGESGRGDGPAASNFNPKPANFFDVQRMEGLAPFQVFNTVRLGIPGTPMPAFPGLSDKETWNLAFYVISLRHQWEFAKNYQSDEQQRKTFDEAIKETSLAQVAGLPDKKLRRSQEALVALRLHTVDDDFKNSLSTAHSYLTGSLERYKQRDFDSAKNKALLAYLEGVEPVEPRLRATDAGVTSNIEEKMSAVREAIDNRKPVNQLTGIVATAHESLDEAEKILDQKELSPWLTFLMAAVILLREGFEAILVIVALIGVLNAAKSARGARWVHGGWIAAVGAGVLTWFFSGWLMDVSGAQRELMEGLTSLFAVAILLYMGFWLHSKTEIGKWRAFIDGRVKGALEGGNLWGLGIISFMAVFREAFETVLFLRALWLESGSQMKTALMAGVGFAFALTFVLSWLLLRYAARIPIRKLFVLSSSLMVFLAFILIGKGFHCLQKTGTLSITAIPFNLHSDFLGLYPTIETMSSQVILLALTLFLWLWSKKSPAYRF